MSTLSASTGCTTKKRRKSLNSNQLDAGGAGLDAGGAGLDAGGAGLDAGGAGLDAGGAGLDAGGAGLDAGGAGLGAGAAGLDPERLPAHVAIIMDGNGRWAQKRLFGRVKGHEKGAEAVRTAVETCAELGVRHLTLYAFSTENWQRPEKEVSALMALLRKFLKNEEPRLMKNNVRLDAIGQIERLPEKVRRALARVMDATARNTGLHLHLALSYGGRAEIVKMVREIAREAADGRLAPDEIAEEVIADHLYTRGVPDPDLMIRTSGEMRISNFLLWQIAYAEIHVTDVLWPDFDRKEFLKILREYQCRERRFGKVLTA
ncbi:MAG: isoprenyl transferase [Desulfobacterales bacterium]|nr:isoprenyl transferase [Desulfobacterales bacterium]